ncbi:MAG: ribosomal protein S18-alanine N-acetyltransferase [Candidatus Latescibacteria bacterium]|jgi:[ribosomal protein S18]-alanine N-acetyltransferase|nr:ribosomal protein S18-alanine N-acetyltransferase [Candidatus Latescibacterota bacterium]
MSAESVFIEQMLPDDLPAVVRIERASYPDPWSSASFSREISAQPISHPIVARRDGMVVGFVVAWFVVDEVHIGNVAVAPDARRQGIGRLLMDTLESQAVAEGCTYSTLEVRESNQSARQLYGQMGYRVIGRRDRYYRHPEEDALVMVRTLSISGAGK